MPNTPLKKRREKRQTLFAGGPASEAKMRKGLGDGSLSRAQGELSSQTTDLRKPEIRSQPSPFQAAHLLQATCPDFSSFTDLALSESSL